MSIVKKVLHGSVDFQELEEKSKWTKIMKYFWINQNRKRCKSTETRFQRRTRVDTRARRLIWSRKLTAGSLNKCFESTQLLNSSFAGAEGPVNASSKTWDSSCRWTKPTKTTKEKRKENSWNSTWKRRFKLKNQNSTIIDCFSSWTDYSATFNLLTTFFSPSERSSRFSLLRVTLYFVFYLTGIALVKFLIMFNLVVFW